jgi:hypothetical protein
MTWQNKVKIPFDVIRKTTANKIKSDFRLDVLIHQKMESYSGWNCFDHLQWVCDLTGLDYSPLFSLLLDGYCLLTDESVSEVWLLSKNNYKTTARLIYQDQETKDIMEIWNSTQTENNQ